MADMGLEGDDKAICYNNSSELRSDFGPPCDECRIKREYIPSGVSKLYAAVPRAILVFDVAL